MLKSFAYMQKDIDIAFYYDIWEEIQGLKWYFYRFAGVNAEEAMQKTLYHTLTHFNANKGNLSAYIKKLAREITKENGRLVFVDFIDETLADDDVDERQANVDTTRVHDFSTDVIESLYLQEDRSDAIVNLALEFMDKFIILCEALKNNDSNTKYYPENFIKECLRISKTVPNFNKMCVDLYISHGDEIRKFLDLTSTNESDWKEADYLLVSSNTSRRVKFVNKKGMEITDADLEDWQLYGKLGEGDSKKRVIKIPYYDLWEYFCDLIDDTKTNEMKFVLGNSFIVKTFGGSVSVLNPDLYNLYDLVRVEILTNLIQDTCGRVLNLGSENIYLLCNPDWSFRKNKRVIRGHEIEFSYEDITDTIQ